MPKTPARPTAMVALLRGINVGGNRKLPMEELRALAASLGLERPSTFIASGNLLFATTQPAATVATTLERAIETHFGFAVPVIVRTAAEWTTYAAGSPFPEADPKFLHLGLARGPIRAGAEAALQARANAGERVAVRGDAVWIDYHAGVARSKLTPVALDKAVGSALTARNWRTVVKLGELLAKAG